MFFSDSPSCSYCQQEHETIRHIFYDCEIAKTPWEDIKNVFYPRLNIPSLDLQSAIIGFLDTSDKYNLILNNILLMYKIALYRKRDKNNINIRNVLSNLKSRVKVEKVIVYGNKNKMEFHNKKWEIVRSILDEF